MNHLAHAVLAGCDDAMIVGGLLGDFWHGAPDPAWPPALATGVRLHRRIDTYTDAHPRVVAARRLFDGTMRRYAGIVLDVWWDHLLSRDFERLTGCELGAAVDRIDAALAQDFPALPPPFVVFAARTRRDRTLARYADRDFVEAVYERISQRLSRANPVAHALPALAPLERELDRTFAAFWPELAAFAGSQSARTEGVARGASSA